MLLDPGTQYSRKETKGGGTGNFEPMKADYISWLFCGPVRRLCAQLSTAHAVRSAQG